MSDPAVSSAQHQQGGSKEPQTLEDYQEEFCHVLCGLLHLVGPLILSHLGVDEPEVLQLRELSSGWRLPAASAYATLRPPELPELHGESSEDTDSGFLPSSHSSSTSIDLPWAQ